ncbi:MAG: hypothetical protein KDD37_04970 [Bdellovibrionales bacterium]|nr:hypothetical protein [Bdellovibrionales bacterium]
MQILFSIWFSHALAASPAYSTEDYQSLFKGSITEMTDLHAIPTANAPSFLAAALNHVSELIAEPSIRLEILPDLGTAAEYDPPSKSILISQRLIDKILADYNERERQSIFTFIIAHEAAHKLIWDYCKDSEDHLTPSKNPCSRSAKDSKIEDEWEKYYQYLKAYKSEHVEIDFIAYITMDKLGIATEPIYDYLSQTRVPWGESKRLTDVMQAERLDRIEQVKNY